MEGTASTVVITTALKTVWDIVESCVTFISDNPIMMVLLVAGMVPVGFKIFKRAKRSVK